MNDETMIEEGAYTIRKGKSLDYALHRLMLAKNYKVKTGSKESNFLSSKDVDLATFLLLKSFRSKHRSNKQTFFDSFEELGRKFTEYSTVDFDNIKYPEGRTIARSLEKLAKLNIIAFEERNRRYKDGRLGPMGLAINIEVIKTAKHNLDKLIM